MKYQIDGILVVEGKSDVSFLSSFIDTLFVTTNGFDVNKDILDFLSFYSKDKDIIVLTDSDEAGEKIRNKINRAIQDIFNVSIPIKMCDKHHKHGVAEAKKEDVISALVQFIKKDNIKRGAISLSELYCLGFVGEHSKDCRFYACKKLHIKFCNPKQFLKYVNYLNIPINHLVMIKEEFDANR